VSNLTLGELSVDLVNITWITGFDYNSTQTFVISRIENGKLIGRYSIFL